MRPAPIWSLSRFDTEQRNCLLSVATPRTVAAGEVVVRRGERADALYAVREGRLKAGVTSVTGRDTTFDILGPSDIFGEVGLFAGGVRTADVTALERCQLDVLRQAALLTAIEKSPNLACVLLGVLAERVVALSEEVEQLTSVDATTRFAGSLLKLAERFGMLPAPQNIQVQVRLSQQDLADLVGLSRVFVNGRLRAWQAEGILSHRAGRLTVHDLPALRRIAAVG